MIVRVPMAKVFRFLTIGLVLGVSVAVDWVCLELTGRQEAVYSQAEESYVGNDFVAYYAGAKLASEGRAAMVYDLPTLHAKEVEVTRSPQFPLLPMAYPPFFEVVLLPFSHLPYLAAYRLWAALTTALVVLAAWRVAPYWQMLVLVPIFPAVAFCANQGQNSNLSAAIFASGLLLLPRKPVAAGVALGLMAYKPQLALAVPFCLLAGGHYRALASTAMTALLTIVIGFIAFGIEPLKAFFPSLHRQFDLFFSPGGFPDLWHRMPTVLVAALKVSGDSALAFGVHLAVAIVASATVVWIWRRSSDQSIRAWSLMAAMPLLTPYFFDYDLALLVVPFAFLAAEIGREGLTTARLVSAGALWMAQPVLFLLPVLVPDAMPVVVRVAPLVWVSLLSVAVLQVRRATSATAEAGWAGEPSCRDDSVMPRRSRA